jgi:hypothetical protein
MMIISMKDFSEKQRRAWVMRYRRGWRMKRIALKMGVTPSEVSKLLKRAMVRAGLPWRPNVRVVRTKPRKIMAISLSDARNV